MTAAEASIIKTISTRFVSVLFLFHFPNNIPKHTQNRIPVIEAEIVTNFSGRIGEWWLVFLLFPFLFAGKSVERQFHFAGIMFVVGGPIHFTELN